MPNEDRLAAAQGLMLRPPSERSSIDPFIVMDVMRAAAAREATGARVIHMEVGQPGTPAPRAAREAVKRALDTDNLGYTLALGMEPLRERIARHYRERHGIAVAPERIVVTAGSSAAFVLSFLALFDAGARVALPAPGYPCYRHILTALGAVPVVLETGPNTRWMPTAGQIDEAPQPRTPRRPADRQPCQSDRNHARTRAAGRDRRYMPPPRIVVHLRRDLSRADLRHAGGDGAAVLRRCRRDQQLLEVLFDDRLARRLDGRAAAARAHDGAACPEPLHLAAGGGAGGGAGRFRRHRGAGGQSPGLHGQSRPAAARAAEGWPRSKIVPADGAFYLYVDVGDYTDDSLAFARPCWRRPASRRRPASISMRRAAVTTCASPTPARPPIWPRCRAAAGLGRLKG